MPLLTELGNSPDWTFYKDVAPGCFRYRFFSAKVGTRAEPTPVGTSVEPLFVIETLEAAGRYNVFVSAVNSSGNEGLRSTVIVAEVLARAAA